VSNSVPLLRKRSWISKKVPFALAIGSLIYAMVCTRPNIPHAVSIVSQFVSNPRREYRDAVKWILRYLRGTSSLKLCFSCEKLVLESYTNLDMAGDVDS
jgi:hypothetical protein